MSTLHAEEPWLAHMALSNHDKKVILGGCPLTINILNVAMTVMSAFSHAFVGLTEISAECNFVGNGLPFPTNCASDGDI